MVTFKWIKNARGEKEMKKIKELLIVACAMALTGCSGIKNTPTEEKIIADISKNYPSMTVG